MSTENTRLYYIDLHVIHQSQRANDSLIDNITTFDRKPELHFDWILKLENIAAVTKQNAKELALGKAQGAVIKCLMLLQGDESWNNVTALFKQQMHRYKEKEESLQELKLSLEN